MLRAVRIHRPLRMDGHLDEEEWRRAEVAEGFVQREPQEGEPASERAWVKVLYDDRNIYFGFMCYDSEPGRIVADEMRRDSNLNENDSVEILYVQRPQGRVLLQGEPPRS